MIFWKKKKEEKKERVVKYRAKEVQEPAKKRTFEVNFHLNTGVFVMHRVSERSEDYGYCRSSYDGGCDTRDLEVEGVIYLQISYIIPINSTIKHLCDEGGVTEDGYIQGALSATVGPVVKTEEIILTQIVAEEIK